MAVTTAHTPGSKKKRSKRRALTLNDVTLVEKSTLKRTILGTSLGNAMEWFDMGVYAYLAAIIGVVFFPGSSPGIQMMASFGAFAAAFLARPIGGLVLGPLGDKLGRQKVLAFTMVLMSVSSFCIGLIPSYDTIGIWAPILLLCLRLLQGFSTGGEFGGAMTFLAEHAPDRIRGFLTSWLEFGTFIGYIAAALIATLVQQFLSEADLYSWGWRIPFFIAGPLGLIGIYMRLRLEETPAFEQTEDDEEAQKAQESATQGLTTMVSGHWRPLLLCMGLVLVYMATNYMVLAYMPSYLSEVVGHSASHGLWLLIAVMAVMIIIQPFMGLATDRFGRRPVIFSGCLGFLIFSIPCFMMLHSDSIAVIFAGLMIMGAFQTCFTASMASTLPALFPTAIRYGAIAVALNISTSLFGGTTPLFSTWLVDTFGNDMLPAYYMMITAVIGMVMILITAESARKPLMGSTPAALDKQEAKEVLAEHHDDIESQIEDIDEQMEALAKQRKDLVEQHPRID
ncbi:glycine betaine/L-proline transporter ProP [Carnimonas bestiolae]|uniref:glycine betaine/L-proline transporter ProP n=1 Tax=Carnimonas bestiolae TaxID=3402172 RepID=UPI003EDBFFF7